jgi:asparagine synthetase B (glutamine-hydrolysing)
MRVWRRFVARLDGMYGFTPGTSGAGLLIGRDRLGIKPIYYAELGAVRLRVGLKAILEIPGATPSTTAYFTLDYVRAPDPRRDKLPPASLMIHERGAGVGVVEFRPGSTSLERGRLGRRCSRAREAVVEQLDDVPLGASLSGCIVRAASDHGAQPSQP